MSEILFLAHRIPYPPDKGDKIRSYHFLRALAERHVVHLGTFVDDPADWAHVTTLERICGEVLVRPLVRWMARARSVAALVTGGSFTTAHYRDGVMSEWVRNLAGRRPLRGAFAFSSSMGPYLAEVPLPYDVPRVMDFCDVDSDKWRQYAESRGFPLRPLFAREARALAAVEARYIRDFDASLVISTTEKRILEATVGAASGRVQVVPNGVDTEFFDPQPARPNPFAEGAAPIVFTGAMDYHANIDAVRWFATDVFPGVRQQVPSAVFAVVGSNPTNSVRALGGMPGVVVTGRVPDVRPYLAHATVVVAPLRIARGVQNKVLEALAMSRPVVATENALQGIPAADEAGVTVTSDRNGMVEAIVRRLRQPADEPRGRRFVQANFGWSAHLASVLALFEESREQECTLESGEAARA